MSNVNQARRATAEVSFDGVDITKTIQPYLLSITYTDNEEDETDDLQIKLQDRDGDWLLNWLEKAITAASSGTTTTSEAAAEIDVSGYAQVKYGSNGDTVRTMQGYLSQLGYALPKYGVDGKFRGETKSALTKFQQDHGLSVDGICGPKTWEALLRAINGTSSASVKVVTANGMKMQAVILRENWNSDGKDEVLDCGQFELDSVDASGPGNTVTLKATSLPYTTSIRQTLKSRAWEQYKLSGIAAEMAKQNGMTCMFESASDPYYERVEQYKTSDIDFLSRLCHNAGISLKATNNILVLFNQAAYESKSSVRTIRRGDGSYTRYKMTSGKADTEYSSCRVRYTLPGGALVEGVAYTADYDADSSSNQQLEINAKVSTESEAAALAAKNLRLHNKYAKSATLTMLGSPGLVAGVTVELTGWGWWDGKYIVKQAKHSISSGGYTTQITLRQIIKDAVQTVSEQPVATSHNVGDTVQFAGGYHYVSSDAKSPTGSKCAAGPAKITKTNPGSAHPWHLIHTDSSSRVYGWVDDGSFS